MKNKNVGLSLIEVLVVIVILSTSLVLIVRSFSMCLRTIVATQGYTVASFLLEDKLWGIRLQEKIEDGIVDEGIFPKPNEFYRYLIEASPVENQLEPESLKEIKATVFWKQGSANREVSVVTYFQNQSEQ